MEQSVLYLDKSKFGSSEGFVVRDGQKLPDNTRLKADTVAAVRRQLQDSLTVPKIGCGYRNIILDVILRILSKV